MKHMEDNLLKIAQGYEDSLSLYEEVNENEIDDVFTEIFSDYKKIIKACEIEEIEVDNDIGEFAKVNTEGSYDDKIHSIEQMKKDIIDIIEESDISGIISEKLMRKYMIRDFVQFIENSSED